VAQIQVGQLGAGAAGLGVGRERGDPVSVDVGDPQLRTGVWSFLADDHAHACRPPGHVQQGGQLGDPRAVTDLIVGVIGRGPHAGRDQLQQLRSVVGQREPDRVRQTLAAHPGQDLVGAPGAVGPDQHLAARTSARMMGGQLGQGGLDHRDVIGRRIGTGVARAQQHRQRFTGPRRAVVDEGPQRVKTEAPLIL